MIIRKATHEDIEALEGRLRKEDAQELIEAGNETVKKAITESFEKSLICLCVEQDGAAQALFGLVPDSICGDSACVWFLGTEQMSLIKKTFVKKSREFVSYWLTLYPRLWNTFPASYIKTCRWLGAMGAKFYPMKEPKGFVLFTIEAK